MAESHNIEWKESWRDEYLKWICGFANAQGGRIYIGKKDDGTVIGVSDARKLMAGLLYSRRWIIIMKIEHVAMYVKNLEAAKDFFVKYFGAVPNNGYHNKNSNFRSFFLTFEDGARLELMNHPEMQDMEKTERRTGLVHIALSAGSREKVDALTMQLKADGYEVISGPRTTGDGYYESCIVAIEGNQIELTV